MDNSLSGLEQLVSQLGGSLILVYMDGKAQCAVLGPDGRVVVDTGQVKSPLGSPACGTRAVVLARSELELLLGE